MACFYPYNNLTLIRLVEERPCLWDKSLDVYRQRIPKKAAWNEIFNLFNPDFELLPKSKKKEYGDAIISRWIHIRDAFSRSLKSMTSTKKYIYYDHMLFMLKNEEYMYDENYIGTLETKIEDKNFFLDPYVRQNVMVKFPYDVIALIENVEKNPCLWDQSIEYYNDEILKESSWRVIAETLEPAFESLNPEKQVEIIESVRLKWYSIKDAFFRVLKTGNKKYVYQDRMQFLVKNMSQDEFQGIQFDDSDPVPSRPQKRKHYFLEDDILDRMDALIADRDDEDFAFFTSLIPSIKKLSNEEKLEFRSEVLQTVRRMLAAKPAESICETVLEEGYTQDELKITLNHDIYNTK